MTENKKFQSFFCLFFLINYKLYKTVKALPKAWDNLPNNDVFLKTKFLEGLEYSCPNNITPYYVGVFNAEILVGIAVLQRVEMYLDDVFRNTNDNYLIRISKKIVSKIVKGNTLVIGNLMHTGQHGLFFLPEAIHYQSYLETLFKAISEIRAEIKLKHKKKIRIIGFKDYFEEDTIHNNHAFFKNEKLYKLQVQPNMVLQIPKEWKTVEGYKGTLKKKYRQRFNAARNKAKTLVKKELDYNSICLNETALFALYKNVSDNARVNSFILNKKHFSHLKAQLKENLKVFAYFLDSNIIGFYTLILNGNTLETYFLGYNKVLQHKHQIYLNMLYDMAQFGIENNFKSIVYARTAMAIKSSIGAKPKTMHIYMKHTNNILANLILKFLVKYLNPVKKWDQRNPFKP